MKLFAIAAIALFVSAQANAVQMIKCGSQEGKTLYASFGKRVTSGNPATVVFFPIEFTIFSGPKTLQDRIIYYRTGDALKIPLTIENASIKFQFPAKGPQGQEVLETFTLDLMSPKDLKGFAGRWTTSDLAGNPIQSVYSLCSVYQ